MTHDQARVEIMRLSRECMLAANKAGTGNAREFDALLKADAALQEYLNSKVAQ